MEIKLHFSPPICSGLCLLSDPLGNVSTVLISALRTSRAPTTKKSKGVYAFPAGKSSFETDAKGITRQIPDLLSCMSLSWLCCYGLTGYHRTSITSLFILHSKAYSLLLNDFQLIKYQFTHSQEYVEYNRTQ